MENFSRIFVLMILAIGVSFGQAMPLERAVGIPARTGNGVCAGSTGTVAWGGGTSGVSAIALGVQSGALTCTTPTATQLCALFPSVGSTAANFHWDTYLVNSGTGTITVALGTGVTNAAYTNTYTVAANSVKHFMWVLTNCAAGAQAAQILSLGTSVF